MDDIATAIELAFLAFHKEFGEGARLEEGEDVVFQFNNCILIISVEAGTLKQKFIGGLPIKVEHALKIYESEDE